MMSCQAGTTVATLPAGRTTACGVPPGRRDKATSVQGPLSTAKATVAGTRTAAAPTPRAGATRGRPRAIRATQPNVFGDQCPNLMKNGTGLRTAVWLRLLSRTPIFLWHCPCCAHQRLLPLGRRAPCIAHCPAGGDLGLQLLCPPPLTCQKPSGPAFSLCSQNLLEPILSRHSSSLILSRQEWTGWVKGHVPM